MIKVYRNNAWEDPKGIAYYYDGAWHDITKNKAPLIQDSNLSWYVDKTGMHTVGKYGMTMIPSEYISYSLDSSGQIGGLYYHTVYNGSSLSIMREVDFTTIRAIALKIEATHRSTSGEDYVLPTEQSTLYVSSEMDNLIARANPELEISKLDAFVKFPRLEAGDPAGNNIYEIDVSHLQGVYNLNYQFEGSGTFRYLFMSLWIAYND